MVGSWAASRATSPAPSSRPFSRMPRYRVPGVERMPLQAATPARTISRSCRVIAIFLATSPLKSENASVVAVMERLHIRALATTDRRHFAAIRPRHGGAFRPGTLTPCVDSRRRVALKRASHAAVHLHHEGSPKGHAAGEGDPE